MSTNALIAAGLLVLSAVLQACAGMIPDNPDLTMLLAKVTEAVTTKPAEYLQTPEGQAFIRSLIQQHAPEPLHNELIYGAVGTGAAGLLMALRALVTGEKSEKASRKRGDMHERINELQKQVNGNGK